MCTKFITAQLKLKDVYHTIFVTKYFSQGYEVNESQNSSLTATLLKRAEIVGQIGSANDLGATGKDLARRSWAVLAEAKSHFQNVDGTLRDYLNTLCLTKNFILYFDLSRRAKDLQYFSVTKRSCGVLNFSAVTWA